MREARSKLGDRKVTPSTSPKNRKSSGMSPIGESTDTIKQKVYAKHPNLRPTGRGA